MKEWGGAQSTAELPQNTTEPGARTFAIMELNSAVGGVLDESPDPVPADRLFRTLEEARAALEALPKNPDGSSPYGIYSLAGTGPDGQDMWLAEQI